MGQFIDSSFPVSTLSHEGLRADIEPPPVSVAGTPDGRTEQRIQVSEYGRYTVDIAAQGRRASEWETLYEFYLRVGGMMNSFRWRDPSSYHNTVSLASIGAGDGSTLSFQLIHPYGSGYNHPVTKPVDGTISVYITAGNGSILQSSRYSVSLTTGICTFSADITGTVTGASQASACIITCVGHGLTTGDTVHLSTFTGDWAAMNDNRYAVTKLTADTFSIPVDTTGYAAWSSNGGAFHSLPQAGEVVKASFTHDYQVRFATSMSGPRIGYSRANAMDAVLLVEVYEP